MTTSSPGDQLIEFPCLYEFKVFGVADADGWFAESARAAVSGVVAVSRDAMRSRRSSGGRYQCVSILAQIQNSDQLHRVYAALRTLDGLKYLL